MEGEKKEGFNIALDGSLAAALDSPIEGEPEGTSTVAPKSALRDVYKDLKEDECALKGTLEVAFEL